MPIKTIKKDIKKYRPVDWFAIVVLASAAFVLMSVLSNKIEQFSRDMDLEAEHAQAYISALKDLKMQVK